MQRYTGDPAVCRCAYGQICRFWAASSPFQDGQLAIGFASVFRRIESISGELAVAAGPAIGIHYPFVYLLEWNASEDADDWYVLVAILAHQDGHAEIAEKRGRHAGSPSQSKGLIVNECD